MSALKIRISLQPCRKCWLLPCWDCNL